jgi:hypothetical protein
MLRMVDKFSPITFGLSTMMMEKGGTKSYTNYNSVGLKHLQLKIAGFSQSVEGPPRL